MFPAGDFAYIGGPTRSLNATFLEISKLSIIYLNVTLLKYHKSQILSMHHIYS